MDELKILIESISGLPDLAIWVIAMYLFFKLAIVGSIFGVARLFILKAYDSFKLKYSEKVVVEKIIEKEVTKVVNFDIGQYLIKGVEEETAECIKKIILATRRDDGFKYIHQSNIDELKEFTERYIKEREKQK
jgi:hypothetical protein